MENTNTSTLNNERLEKNFNLFIRYLVKNGINPQAMVDDIGEDIKNGMFGTSNPKISEIGSLLELLLWELTPIALELNKIYPESHRVEDSKLIKVCLLHQISKALMFVKNESMKTVFNPNTTSNLKMGAKSISICFKYGIPLDEEEVEAFLILESDFNDIRIRYNSKPLALIIKQSNEILNSIIK